jgi:nucleotide-binding universal stress UspA family protein
MIKRILVALDPDPDTPVATKFALRLAKRFDASITGVAVVDTTSFHTEVGGGGLGGGFYGHEIWTELTEDTRKEALRLLENFKSMVEKENVTHTAIKKEGVSHLRIIEEMKYHDLLIVGRDPHFYYGDPEVETDTLAQVVKSGVAPTLIVTDEYNDVEKVLIAFDGSAAAARSLHGFVQLLPYGKDIEIELLNISKGDSTDDMDQSAAILSQADTYLRSHNFNYVSKKVMGKGKPSVRILERVSEFDPDLIVLGAHSVSAVRRATFGSTTYDMIKNTEKPLFLSP